MASWKCKTCGYTKEGRCKPQICPQCQEKGNFEKVELPNPERKSR
jgi:rubrerythrin